MLSPSAALIMSAVLVLANGFFVASEFAIVKLRPTRVQELINQGSTRARLLAGILGRLDAYLSANQLGVTLASLALGWVGEPAIAKVLQPHLTALGQWTSFTTHGLALGISFTVISFLHVTVGELVPKSVALQLAEPVALWAAVPLRVFHFLTFPFAWILKTTRADSESE